MAWHLDLAEVASLWHRAFNALLIQLCQSYCSHKVRVRHNRFASPSINLA
jgi:hypothetical protein